MLSPAAPAAIPLAATASRRRGTSPAFRFRSARRAGQRRRREPELRARQPPAERPLPSRVAFRQEGRDFVPQVLVVHRPAQQPPHLPRRVDQEILRDAGGAKVMGGAAVAVAQLRVAEAVAADELAPVAAQVTAVDAEDREPRPTMLPLEALQRRRLLLAGDAPRGP